MKIGDKVRFLSDVGGGIISGFEKGNIVLVEDEDGFDIPVPASEVVVIETDNYNIAKVDTMGRKSAKGDASKPQGKQGVINIPDEEPDPSDMPIKYKPKPEERKDGEKLTVCLAFVPVSVKELSTTKFEAYIVNDCNYYINYAYMSAENAVWKLRSTGNVAPNTKVFLEEFTHADLNDLDRVAVQLIAYKEDKPFALKQPVSVDIRVDTTKFYKLHTFRESIFFDEPTLEYYLVKEDTVTRPLVVSAEEIKKAMYDKESGTQPKKKTHDPKPDANAILEIDLHADEVLETTAGMSAADIKEYQLSIFRKTMDEHRNEKGRKIVFIHGKGEGVLRNAILTELKHKYKSCQYQDASFLQYGFGATMVTIR